MDNTTKILALISVGILITSAMLVQNKREIEMLQHQQSLIEEKFKEPEEEEPEYAPLIELPSRGYDFYNKNNKTRRINYTDAEIRMLREINSFKDGDSYIHTPGRHVPSHEEMIEQYIEDNIEEIIEDY